MTAAEALVRVENSVEAADAAHYAIDYESDLEALSVLRAAVEERDKLKSGLPSEKVECPFCGKVFIHTEERLYAEEIERERDKLKGEVERLLRQLTQETDESDMWRTKAEKAETELAFAKPLLEAVIFYVADALPRSGLEEAFLTYRKKVEKKEKA